MRFFNNGAFFFVRVFKSEVEKFKQQWPCSGLPSKSICFEFQTHNGDLVGIRPKSEWFNGDALVALMNDARAYGIKRLSKCK